MLKVCTCLSTSLPILKSSCAVLIPMLRPSEMKQSEKRGSPRTGSSSFQVGKINSWSLLSGHPVQSGTESMKRPRGLQLAMKSFRWHCRPTKDFITNRKRTGPLCLCRMDIHLVAVPSWTTLVSKRSASSRRSSPCSRTPVSAPTVSTHSHNNIYILFVVPELDWIPFTTDNQTTYDNYLMLLFCLLFGCSSVVGRMFLCRVSCVMCMLNCAPKMTISKWMLRRPSKPLNRKSITRKWWSPMVSSNWSICAYVYVYILLCYACLSVTLNLNHNIVWFGVSRTKRVEGRSWRRWGVPNK